jgi:hypothetical protein
VIRSVWSNFGEDFGDFAVVVVEIEGFGAGGRRGALVCSPDTLKTTAVDEVGCMLSSVGR